MSLISGVGPSTSSTTGFVTPFMVRSPFTLSFPSPAFSTLVDLKVIFGFFSASKKSGERRWSSRFCSRVSMLAVSITASTLDLVRSFSSSFTVPAVLPNSPRTLEIAMCRTVKLACVWLGLMVQVLV